MLLIPFATSIKLQIIDWLDKQAWLSPVKYVIGSLFLGVSLLAFGRVELDDLCGQTVCFSSELKIRLTICLFIQLVICIA